MKKVTVAGLAIALGLLLTCSVYAWDMWGGGGSGSGSGGYNSGNWGGSGSGSGSGSTYNPAYNAFDWGAWCKGMGYGQKVNTTNLNKFYQETQALRDQLIAKQIELRNEFNSPTPDPALIAQLQQEIVDLQLQIQAIAKKYNLPAWLCAVSTMGPGYYW